MRTLGWQLLDWAAEFLPSPSNEDEPFTLTDEQARLVLAWFEVDDRGEFLHRRGALRMAKGWGKSPLLAFIALAELAGPVLFSHFAAKGEVSEWGYEFETGEPVGRRWGTRGDPKPWVQIAACSEDQTENTYEAINDFLTANDGIAAKRLGIDWGKGRLELVAPLRGKLNKVTAAAGSREGQRVTFAVLDETHLWTETNGGLKLARTLRRNVAKMGGRSFETTNSFDPAEMSVAQRTHDAVEKGVDDGDSDGGIYYYAVEGPKLDPECSDEDLLAGMRVAYGDAHWVPLERLLRDARDPDMPWEDVVRFFLNRNEKGEGRAVDPRLWAELATADPPEPGERIGIGFDGSISDDATALIGCTEDGRLFELAVWLRPPGAPDDWRIPRLEVEQVLVETFERFDVGRMVCDPAKWPTEIERWAERWNAGRTADEAVVTILDTNQHVARMWRACDRFTVALKERTVTHTGSDVLTQHVLAMHRKKVNVKADDDDGRTKYVFVKGQDRRKIDAGIAAVLAVEAAQTMPAKVEYEPWVVFG